MESDGLQESLSAENPEIMPYLPFLLQDLWALGGRPDIQTRLIRQLQLEDARILDLACGKGASLIEILGEQAGVGLGVDLVADFIRDAGFQARQRGLEHRIAFRVEDILTTIETERDYDLVLYAMDSDILGSVQECYQQLAKVLKPKGYALVEALYARDGDSALPARPQFLAELERAGFRMLQESIWETKQLKHLNQVMLTQIKQRAQELCFAVPEKKDLFRDYVDAQISENQDLENRFECVTILSQWAQTP